MRKAGRKISSINVVPYLDVLLVLLVIFMITAPLFNLGGDSPARVGRRGDAVRGISDCLQTSARGAPLNCTTRKRETARASRWTRGALMDALRLICWSEEGRVRGVIIAADEKRFYGEVVGN